MTNKLHRYKLRSKVAVEDVTEDYSVWVRWGDNPVSNTELSGKCQHMYCSFTFVPPCSCSLKIINNFEPVNVHPLHFDVFPCYAFGSKKTHTPRHEEANGEIEIWHGKDSNCCWSGS